MRGPPGRFLDFNADTGEEQDDNSHVQVEGIV